MIEEKSILPVRQYFFAIIHSKENLTENVINRCSGYQTQLLTIQQFCYNYMIAYSRLFFKCIITVCILNFLLL